MINKLYHAVLMTTVTNNVQLQNNYLVLEYLSKKMEHDLNSNNMILESTNSYLVYTH